MSILELSNFKDFIIYIYRNNGHNADLFINVPLRIEHSNEIIYFDDFDNDFDSGMSSVASQLIYMCRTFGMGMIKMQRAGQGYKNTCSIICIKNQLTNGKNIMIVKIHDSLLNMNADYCLI